ncbi:hypothetical protein [Wolbachia endosymbiont of Tetranychus urticae]
MNRKADKSEVDTKLAAKLDSSKFNETLKSSLEDATVFEAFESKISQKSS